MKEYKTMNNRNINSIKNKFTKTYENNSWHMGSGESKSGLGSSLEYTIHFRDNLVRIITQYEIKKIFDSSCGDWNWMKEIKDFLPDYVGNDIVDALVAENNKKFGTDKISFVSNDCVSQMKNYTCKYFDLVICRHTMEHLENNDCIDIINEIKRVSKYAIITSTNTLDKNFEIENADGVASRAINLDITPYNEVLGTPIEKFFDSKEPVQSNGCFGYLYKF